MGLQVNAKEILSLLYYNRDVIDFLFGTRESVTVNELLSRTDITPEQYQKLIATDILYEHQQVVGLNDAVIAMFEDFMEIGEVTPSFIADYINELKRNIKYYREGNEYRFLRSIKKYLKRIGVAISREIIKLQKNVDDTYKNESNYRIKLQKLEDYRLKRDTIIEFIERTEEVTDETRKLFDLTNDLELHGIVSSLRQTLIENLDYLIEIQTDITDFINKIQFQLDVYKKAQRIKEVKDQGQLHYKTNFKEVVNSLNPIGFNGIRAPRTKIAVEFLYMDEGHIICQKVAEKYKITRLMARRLAEKLPANFKDQRAEAFVKLDTLTLLNKFIGQKRNLFEFLMDYKFPKTLGTVTFEERITLFVEIAMEFDKKLDFRYTLEKYEWLADDGKTKRLGYTLILPGKVKEKKAA
ncbi:MAG TPA: hypothetical protein VNZ49_04275 [Bacteroidia bacterium]|jgi:hypothetical protein|nr:hypothetical protein [Bacteroidia bacterium]